MRRLVVFGTLLFCMFCILWILLYGDNRSVLEVIVMSSYGLAFSVIGSYIFGAVWDDANVMKELGAKAYEEEPPTIDGPQA